MQNEIQLVLTINGQQANAAIQLTDKNIQELYKSFKYGQQAVNGFETSLLRSFENARNLFQGIRESFSALKETFGGLLEEYGRQELGEQKLATALRQSGQFSNEAMEDFKQYAGALQQTTLYGDEQYLSAMGMLTAMGLNTDQAKQAAVQVANLATLMGTDLQGAVRVMGDVSAGNGTMINRYIKGLDETIMKSGDTAKIIEYLNTRIGGQAEDAAKTGAGAMIQMKNAMGEMKESGGMLISQALLPIVTAIKDFLFSLSSSSPILSGVIVTVGALGAAFIALRVTGISAAATAIFTELIPAIISMGETIALWAMYNPLTAILVAVGVLAAGIAAAVALSSSGNEKLSDSEKEVINNADAEKIKFEQLTKAILDESKPLEERNAKIKEAQKMYPDFLANMSIQKTKHEDLVKEITKETKAYEKLLEKKVLNERLDLAIKDLAKKQNEDIEPTFWENIIGGISRDASSAFELAAQRSTEGIIQAQKKVKDITAQLNALDLESANNKDKGLSSEEKDKLFNKYKDELTEAQRHESEMLKITDKSQTKELSLKIEHFNDMISLYKKFNKDITNLVNQRTEAEAQLAKISPKAAPKVDFGNVKPLGLDAEGMGAWNKPKEKMSEDEQKQIENSLVEDEFKRRKAEADLEYKINVDKYGKLDILAQQHEQKLKEIDKDRIKSEQEKSKAQIKGQIDTLNFIAQGMNKYTVMAKLAAIFEASLKAKEAVMTALAAFPPPFNYIAAAAVGIVAAKNVADIAAQEPPKMSGYAEGGLLPQGKAGYVEGWHNEIIAPEKTFVDLFRTELRPQIYAGMQNDNSELIKAIKDQNKKIENWQRDLSFRFSSGEFVTGSQKMTARYNSLKF